jgi:nitrite reductase/ring-hydroxylating ferredoxin subunit
MVGFVQHAIIEALNQDLHEFDPELEHRAVKAWNKICMVILEMLARAYGNEREAESFEDLLAVNPDEVLELSVDSYEKGLGIRRRTDHREVVVARAEEIPQGERKIVEVDGHSIGIFHHKSGWYAIRNSCLHRGGPVATGELKGDHIICPWHGYTYNLADGKLLIDPGARLETYPVTIENGEVRLRVPVMFTSFEPTEKGEVEAAGNGSDAMTKVSLKENEFNPAEIKPGQIKLVHLDGQAVAVYNVGGMFYATQDECTHAGGPLSEGELDGKTVTCPWHFSCFDVTNGAVECRPATRPLQTFKVVIEGEIGRVEL